MVDETARAWRRITKTLSSSLPGDWKIGRSGIRTILVRQPIDWVVVWIGLDRIRRADAPYLIGGDTPLVLGPFRLAVGHGRRSDQIPNHPRTVDLLQPGATEIVEDFVTQHLLPRVDPWTPDRLTAECEDQYAQPHEQRGRPIIFPEAAGWRIINNTDSPVGPATEAAEWLSAAMAPNDATWYRDLITAWNTGGRPAALQYLQDQRTSAIASLKLE